ncbi:hypothetical protein U2087_15545, partial [Listeria monocytogenes]|uniref:hypothetical protein n=1 Tax=Listeria monocytogenes TaxID=1639 RepID=UPI002FDC4D09
NIAGIKKAQGQGRNSKIKGHKVATNILPICINAPNKPLARPLPFTCHHLLLLETIDKAPRV